VSHPENYMQTSDQPGVYIEFVDEQSELPDGPSTGAFLVRRSAVMDPANTYTNIAAVTVPYTVSGTATPGADYAPLGGSVTLPEATFAASITVSPTDDLL